MAAWLLVGEVGQWGEAWAGRAESGKQGLGGYRTVARCGRQVSQSMSESIRNH